LCGLDSVPMTEVGVFVECTFRICSFTDVINLLDTYDGDESVPPVGIVGIYATPPQREAFIEAVGLSSCPSSPYDCSVLDTNEDRESPDGRLFRLFEAAKRGDFHVEYLEPTQLLGGTADERVDEFYEIWRELSDYQSAELRRRWVGYVCYVMQDINTVRIDRVPNYMAPHLERIRATIRVVRAARQLDIHHPAIPRLLELLNDVEAPTDAEIDTVIDETERSLLFFAR
jgi:hypothetical protein